MEPEDPRTSPDSSVSTSPSEHDDASRDDDGESASSVNGDTNPMPRDPAPGTSSERADQAEAQADTAVGDVDLDFGDDDLPEHLHLAAADTLHAADFGVIRLDDDGHVEFYNQFEQTLSGMPEADVEGRSFFEEVAPCTYSERFSGKFFEGVREGEMDVQFVYTFSYRMEPLMVKIRLCRNSAGENYVLVNPMQ